MKTFFTRLFVHFEAISHPAGGWFTKGSSSATGQKKSGSKRATRKLPSPDSVHVRGRSSKKSNTTRRTLAP